MKPLPKQYAWLDQVGQLPRTIVEARRLLAVVEGRGAADNPTIMAWAEEIGGKVEDVFTADSVPWCGLFAAVVAKRAGKEVVKDPLWALNWGTFGQAVKTPGLGDVLVFVRKTATGARAGHVGFYLGEDDRAFHVLGGNQSDAVTVARIARSRLYAARRPAYTNPPASVRPYRVAAGGALSVNEA